MRSVIARIVPKGAPRGGRQVVLAQRTVELAQACVELHDLVNLVGRHGELTHSHVQWSRHSSGQTQSACLPAPHTGATR
jgi:hypothetical protein